MKPPSLMTLAKRSPWLFYGVFAFGFGAFFFPILVYTSAEQIRFQREGRYTEARVITKSTFEMHNQGQAGTAYSVTYRFRAPDGKVYQGQDTVSPETWGGLRELGPVRIQYLPSRPWRNQIDRDRGPFNALIGLFVVVSGGLLIAGCVQMGWGGRDVFRERWLWRAGQAGEATVTAVSRRIVDQVTQWSIRYRYKDPLGHSHHGESEPMPEEEAKLWKKGDRGRIRFDPERPQRSVWVGNLEAE